MNTQKVLAASAVLTSGVIAMTGCSAYDAVVHKYTTSTFTDVAAFTEEAAVEAGWLPADATEITVRSSTITNAPDAVIALTSASKLGADCVEVDRSSAPTFTLDDAPNVYSADTLFVCGDWSVLASDDGWYGWTPNAEEERAAAAAGP